jgi:hypothetical protein
VGFPSEKTENFILEYSFQHMPGSLPVQSQQMYSSQLESNNKWTKVSYNRGRSTQEKTERGAKQHKHQTSTSIRYTALLDEESEDQQQKAGPENTSKPPPI